MNESKFMNENPTPDIIKFCLKDAITLFSVGQQVAMALETHIGKTT